jgi:UDP-N-acetylmuramoyl-tripeptide--D-alanyl-D-alanine ligase
MIELTLADTADAAGGTLHDADPTARVTGGVEYDSRRIEPGGLFLALPGEHVDGHAFAASAVDRGAVAVLCTRAVPVPRIEVTDGIAAVTALATAVARRLSATVLGITGSSGKTSTKDLLGQVLARAGSTVAPAGSHNNELGHPYTVLQADERTRFLVLELGARGIGHIAHLTRIAPPDIGLVLNVGTAHLGEFGSRESIAQAKGELVEALPADGVAVLNADDPLVRAMADRTAARVVTFGTGAGADVRASGVVLDELGRPAFTAHADGASATVRLRLVGAHHVANALAVTAAAGAVGMPLPDIAAALADAAPASRWRMEVTERDDGVMIINDAYNANPESMRAALETLAAVTRSRGGRAIAVLGQMAELGVAERAEHERIGRLAAGLDIARVLTVGDTARRIGGAAALERSWDGEAQSVPDADAAIAVLRADVRPGDVVLVKASRAASLERVALAIAEDGGNRDPAEARGDDAWA